MKMYFEDSKGNKYPITQNALTIVWNALNENKSDEEAAAKMMIGMCIPQAEDEVQTLARSLKHHLNDKVEFGRCQDCGKTDWDIRKDCRVCKNCRKTHGI